MSPLPAKSNSEWNSYWAAQASGGRWLYNFISEFYRKRIIRPAVNHFVGHKVDGSGALLHAGCGTGEVAVDIARKATIVGLDISRQALEKYRKVYGKNAKIVLGDLLDIPFKEKTFQVVFNLGVMEHFLEDDIHRILVEFHRVLRDGGKLIVFWPPVWGLSVMFLGILHFIFRKVLRTDIRLHPPEPTHVKSYAQIEGIFRQSGFKVEVFYFGPRDFFTHQIIIARKDSG